MEHIYFFCAVFGSLFVIAQFILTLFAGFGMDDAGADSDFSDGGDVETDHSGADFFRVLSIRTVTAGITFFGLTGMAGTKLEMRQGIVFAIAAVCGLIALVIVYFLYRLISHFRSDGSVSDSTLPGSEGNVYVRIPPRRSGSGKVIVNQQGRSMEYEAFSDFERELAAGEPIVVKEVLSSTQVLIEPRAADKPADG